jgi:4-amino-4-deoxy-L-arabinose transferase-like glycosyltransferase
VKHRALWIVVISTLVGGYLRFANLDLLPFWIDEVLFIRFIESPPQEFIPVYLAKILCLEGEFEIRFPFALAGTLTIPALYYVAKNKDVGALLSMLVAVCPLFVFWSRLARPYAFAGLFVVLGWRFWPCYFVAMLTTPISVIGFRLPEALKSRKMALVGVALACVAGLTYWIRPDIGRTEDFLSLHFLFNAKRIWYIPLLVMALYCSEYILPYGLRIYHARAKRNLAE